MKLEIGAVDTVVIVAYLLVIVGLGCWVGLRKRGGSDGGKDYFLAGGTLNWFVIGLALFLTFFIMMPVWSQINDQAFKPFMAEEIWQAVLGQPDSIHRQGWPVFDPVLADRKASGIFFELLKGRARAWATHAEPSRVGIGLPRLDAGT